MGLEGNTVTVFVPGHSRPGKNPQGGPFYHLHSSSRELPSTCPVPGNIIKMGFSLYGNPLFSQVSKEFKKEDTKREIQTLIF